MAIIEAGVFKYRRRMNTDKSQIKKTAKISVQLLTSKRGFIAFSIS